MLNPLIQKLAQFKKLSTADRQILEGLVDHIKDFAIRQDVIREGERPDHVHLLLEGWAARYKILPGGERQILGYLIPGDLCDIHVTLLPAMDHSIVALSQCRIGCVPRVNMASLIEKHTKLSSCLFWSTLVDEAILREWLISVGRRPAKQRITHLICEMLVRSKAVGLVDGASFEMLVNQEQLADTLGITAAYVNRIMQRLRRDNLIETVGRRITIKNFEQLAEVADFQPVYLHQNNSRRVARRARG